MINKLIDQIGGWGRLEQHNGSETVYVALGQTWRVEFVEIAEGV